MKVLLMVSLCAMLLAAASAQYKVSVERLTTAPIISEAMSTFDYNYNSAYVPFPNSTVDCLAVRVQDIKPNATNRYDVGPSSIVISCGNGTQYPFGPISPRNIVVSPSMRVWQEQGTEDPRVVYIPSENAMLMFYTAVNSIVNKMNPKGNCRAMLSVARCDLTSSPDCSHWSLQGPILPDVFWSKSGALLVNTTAQGPNATHFLFWGDLNICVAETTDFRTFTPTKKCIVEPRKGMFDSTLVESGPPPLKLWSGDNIFFYNSARQVQMPNPKPNWTLQYNLGFVILDGADPTKVVQRAAQPVMSPQLPWEQCNDQYPVHGLTPNVIFVEGAKQLSDSTVLLYYQGCDSRMGMALATITRQQHSPPDE